MKKNNEKNTKISKKNLETLGWIIHTAEKFKNSYFWSSPSLASLRRKMERDNSYDTVEWIDGGNVYTAAFRVSCSVNNVYASGIYTKNGKKTTLTAVRNSYKRLRSKR